MAKLKGGSEADAIWHGTIDPKGKTYQRKQKSKKALQRYISDRREDGKGKHDYKEMERLADIENDAFKRRVSNRKLRMNFGQMTRKDYEDTKRPAYYKDVGATK